MTRLHIILVLFGLALFLIGIMGVLAGYWLGLAPLMVGGALVMAVSDVVGVSE